jgi:hypothetical protein
MPVAVLVFGLLFQTSDANVRAWPGVCPQACCSYNTEWIAAEATQVFAEPRASGDAAGAPIFVLQPGESVRALTGTLFTVERGILQVIEDFSADASYPDFSERHRQMVTLNAGETREVFAVRGANTYRIAHKNTIVDANLLRVGTRDVCSRAKPRCVAILTKSPFLKWWVMVMNARNQSGWIEDPRSFTVLQPCR